MKRSLISQLRPMNTALGARALARRGLVPHASSDPAARFVPSSVDVMDVAKGARAKALGRAQVSPLLAGTTLGARAWGVGSARPPSLALQRRRPLSSAVRAFASDRQWDVDPAFDALLEVHDLQSRLTDARITEETLGAVSRYYPALDIANQIAAACPTLASVCRREVGRLPLPEPARTRLLERFAKGGDVASELVQRAARIRSPSARHEPASEPLGSESFESARALEAAITARDEVVLGRLDDATLQRFASRLTPSALLPLVSTPRAAVERPYVHSSGRGGPPPPPPENPGAKWCEAVFRIWDRGLALRLPGFGDVRGVFGSGRLQDVVPFENLSEQGQSALARLFRRAQLRGERDASVHAMDPLELRDSVGAPTLFALNAFTRTLQALDGAGWTPIDELRGYVSSGRESFEPDLAVAMVRSRAKAIFDMEYSTLSQVAHLPELLDYRTLLERHPPDRVLNLLTRLVSSHRRSLDARQVADLYTLLDSPFPERWVTQASLEALSYLARELKYPIDRLRIGLSAGIVPFGLYPVTTLESNHLAQAVSAYRAEDEPMRARGAADLLSSLQYWSYAAYGFVLSQGVSARLGPLGSASAEAYQDRYTNDRGSQALARSIRNSTARHPAALAVALGTLFRDPTQVLRSCFEDNVDLPHEERERWTAIAETLSALDVQRLSFVIDELDRYPDFESVPVRLEVLSALEGPSSGGALRALLERARAEDPARAEAIIRALWAYAGIEGISDTEVEAVRYAAGAVQGRAAPSSVLFQLIARASMDDPPLDGILAAIDRIGPASASDVSNALRERVDLERAWKIPLDDFDRVDRELEIFVKGSFEPAFQRKEGDVVVAGVRLPVHTRASEDSLVPALIEPTWTPSTLRLYHQVADALAAGQGRRIEGPPGEGKSSVVQFLAAATNRRLRRINMRPSTEPADLLGFYGEGEVKHGAEALAAMGEAGRRRLCKDYGIDVPEDADEQIAALMVAQRRVEWIQGVVVQAMVDGDILLLEEYDLAGPAVLEGALNSVLDKRRSTGRGGERVDAHPDFVLFATGNSVAELGRQEPSAAFRSRLSPVVVHPSTREDFEIYLSERLGTGTTGGPVDRALVRGLADLHHELRTLGETGDLGSGSEVVFTYRDLKKVSDRFNALRGDPRHALSDADLLRREVDEVYCMRFGGAMSARKAAAVLNRSLPASSPRIDFYGALTLEETATEIRVHDVALKKVNPDSDSIPLRDVRLLDTPRIRKARYLMMKALAMKENVLLIGDPGCGKTALAEEMAHLAAQPFYRIVLNETSDHYDLIGARSDRGFEPKQIVVAAPYVKSDPPGLVLIDEANLAREGVLDELNRLFDARELELPTEKAPLVFDEDFKVVLAMNDENLAGRKSLSRPVSNRMTIFVVPPITSEETREIVRAKFSDAAVRPEILDAFSDLHQRVSAAYASGALGAASPSTVFDVSNPRTLFRAVEMFTRTQTSPERVAPRLVEIAQNIYAQSPDPADNQELRRMIMAWLSATLRRGRP